MVQAAAAALPDLRRDAVFGARRTRVVDADLTSVLCHGQWLTLWLAVDDLSGVVLSVDILESSDTASRREWLAPIAAAVGAAVVVTDDTDSFKPVADDLGLARQVCKKHVARNTNPLVDEVAGAIVGAPDSSLGECGVSKEQAARDLAGLRELIHTRRLVPMRNYTSGTYITKERGPRRRGKRRAWRIGYGCCCSTGRSSGCG